MSDLPPPSPPPEALPPPTPPQVEPAAPAPLPPVVPPADTARPPPEVLADDGDPKPATPEDKTLSIVMYLLPLLGLSSMISTIRLPVAAAIAPLVLWLVKKDQSRYLDIVGKEVVNFNICAVACFVVLHILYVIGSSMYLGWLFVGISSLLWIAWLILTGLSAYTASDGKFYRFPLSYPILK